MANVETSHFLDWGRVLKAGAHLEEGFLARPGFRSHWRRYGCGTVDGIGVCWDGEHWVWQAGNCLLGCIWDSLGNCLPGCCWNSLESYLLWCWRNFLGKLLECWWKSLEGKYWLSQPSLEGVHHRVSPGLLLAPHHRSRKKKAHGLKDESSFPLNVPALPSLLSGKREVFTGPSSSITKQVKEEELGLRICNRNRVLQFLNFLCQFWQFVFFKEFVHFI